MPVPGEIRVIGGEAGDDLKQVKDSAGGTALYAGRGRLKLPGSEEEIRAWNGRLWVFDQQGDPLGMLSAPGSGGEGGATLPDGSERNQPLVWSGVAWIPATTLAVQQAAVGQLLTQNIEFGNGAAITEDGIYPNDTDECIGWDLIEKLGRLNADAPHGLPLTEFEGKLRCSIPLDAPNLREFAWRSEMQSLERKVDRLVPDVSVPVGGSVGFDQDRDGSMIITLKKGGRVYRGKVVLTEV